MFAYGILKVIYAPHKAFKEIAQNPKYAGPILVMILFMAGNTALSYASLSKTYVEQTLPAGTLEKRDEWTENATLWGSTRMLGVAIVENDTDYVGPTLENLIPIRTPVTVYYGNKSIQFSINNSASIWMQLDGVNCSMLDYSNISMRIKRLSPVENLENATIYLLSTTTDYFYYNFTEKLNPEIGVWNNITVPLTTSSWSSRGSPDPSNITGLKLEFSWANPQDIALLIDGIFFHGTFSSQVADFSVYLIAYYFFISFMQFTIQWVVLGGLVYIVSRALGGKALWKTSLILIGFSFMTLFIQAIIYTIAFWNVPTIYFRFELLGKIVGESESAYDAFVADNWLLFAVYQYVSVAVSIWTIVLFAIAIRIANDFSWSKSALIAVVSYYAGIIISSFLA